MLYTEYPTDSALFANNSYGMATTADYILGHDNTSASTTSPIGPPFEKTGVTITGIIIFVFLVIGVTLNTLTMLIICKYPTIRSVFTYFIFSLCVSDLLSAIISPLFWYRRTLGFNDWNLPPVLCKIYWATDIATTFSTSIHVSSFVLIRWFFIRMSHIFLKISRKSGIVWILSIWLVSILCGFIPFFLFFEARPRDRHSSYPDARWPVCTISREWYQQYVLFQKIAYSIFLFLPMCFVVLFSLSIIVFVNESGMTPTTVNQAALRRRNRKDKQAVVQLTLIVFSFLLGYIPFTIYEFWSVVDHPNTPYFRSLDYWLGMTEYLLLRLSECLNPIFYNLSSSRMREHTKKYIKETAEWFKCKKVEQSRRESTSNGKVWHISGIRWQKNGENPSC